MSRRAAIRQAIQPQLAWAAIITMIVSLSLTARAQQTNSGAQGQDKDFDIRSSIGDMHVGSDADARAIGLPLYPGARLKQDKSKNSANLAVLTEAFGVKLLVANYESNDSPSKLIDYYRDKLKKYGKVLECHSATRDGGILVNSGKDDSDDSKELKCDRDNTGDVIELKVGTQDNQHVVSVEPAEKGAGATFALVYVRTRGKQGDI
jgi:hypothetical protein